MTWLALVQPLSREHFVQNSSGGLKVGKKINAFSKTGLNTWITLQLMRSENINFSTQF